MGWNMMDYGGMMGYGGWWFLFAVIFWVLLAVALIFAIYWLYRNSFGTGKESPAEIVKRRYAKGEITKKEFDGLMKDLGGSG